jgi:hypothetical protein
MTKPSVPHIIIGSLILVVGVGIVIFSLIANAPTKTSVIVSKKDMSPKYSLNLVPLVIVNRYFNFDYPAIMTPTPTTLVSGEVAAYTFVHHDIATWNLAIEVVPDPSDLLSSNSGYEYRKINPQVYQESTVTIHNQPIHIMTDTTYGGFSKIAFFVYDNYQASVSLYGDDTNGLNALNDTFNMILNSWQWQVN